jgi:hypothetical protein
MTSVILVYLSAILQCKLGCENKTYLAALLVGVQVIRLANNQVYEPRQNVFGDNLQRISIIQKNIVWRALLSTPGWNTNPRAS